MKKMMFTVGLLLTVLSAYAGTITINSAASGNVDWNSAIWGDPAAVPTTGNDYVHDDSSTAVLLGLGGTYGSFAGDKLTLDSGTQLYNKGGGALGCTLYLNGGQWQTRSGGNAIVLGSVRVEADSNILLIDGSMELRTGLSSAAGAEMSIGNFSQAGRSMVIDAIDNGFTGNFSIMDTGNADETWSMQFNRSYSNATLVIQGNQNNADRAAIYQLTNSISFKNVSMPNGTGGKVALVQGTYDAAALDAAGVSSNYYNDLGGTIEVLDDYIEINPNISGNVGWNTAIWGLPVAAPTNGFNYAHDDAASATLLGMGGTYGSFTGDRLRLDSGAVLYNKGGGATGGILELNGGQWQTRSAGTAIILGNVRVTDNSNILLVDGNMELRCGISCASNAVLTVGNYNKSSKSMVIDAIDQGFEGTFAIADSGLNANTWNIQFNRSYTNATLKMTGLKNDAAYAAVYQLTNTIQFAAVQMPNGSGGLVTLSPGIYDAAALAAAGVSGDYYNDLGGRIQVGASAYATWADGWGVDIGSETNDYDGDLYVNLYEYGMGGDPTNNGDWGEVPVFGDDTGTLIYVHVQRTDDASLTYYLETEDDLVSGSWTNAGYSVSGTNVTGGTFDYVTNTIPTTLDKTFIRLMIENL